jgi:hypothetical protein
LPVIGITTATPSGSLRFDDIETLKTSSNIACRRVFKYNMEHVCLVPGGTCIKLYVYNPPPWMLMDETQK